MLKALLAVFALLFSFTATAGPAVQDGDFVAKNFVFASGQSLPELRLHYRTLGTLRRDIAGHALNAVLMLHGTTGTGKNFLAPSFADALFGKGQPLDAEQYFIVMPDGIGRGGSSKPSDGMGMAFPHYGYRDLVAAQHQLLREGLNIDHIRLALGTSMGGMHCWLWGENFPDYADAILPIASQPVAVTGRNLLWRTMIMDAIRADLARGGGKAEFFARMRPLFALMTESARSLQMDAETQVAADDFLRAAQKDSEKFDPVDFLYWFAAVDDYDPEPALARIKAKLLAVNFADDLLNPPELGVMEQAIPRIAGARFVLIPADAESRGHMTQVQAKRWAPYVQELLGGGEK